MSMKALFTAYLKALAETNQRGDAREESFYPALRDLLLDAAQAAGLPHVAVTVLPKATDAGNPDFRLWNGSDRIIGYIEAKKPTEEYLDRVEESEQLRRYRATFPNLILTNFLEFRLYRNGELTATALLGRPVVLNRLRAAPPVEKPDALAALLEQFLAFSLPPVFTAESLAVELAKRTRFLREVTAQQLAAERDHPGVLTGFYEAFQHYLIGSLTLEDFADLYAQTIAYGLFAARVRARGLTAANGFSRRAAFHSIPHTIGVLRDLFRFISLGDLPEPLAWCVDDIAEVLAVADAPGILDRYYRDGKGSDPIVHFYETFLAQYDPAERERRGVYYTPEPVVGYIVRSLHGLLQTEFGKAEGLAAPDVTLLDPAAGTMTFVARAAQEAVRAFTDAYGAGARGDFIKNHILRNFYAFELMMAPYAVGHLKMAFFLDELGYRLQDNERMPFYLTNTLDDLELEQSRLPGLASLAEESRLAGAVKKQTPVLVIQGNPPYSAYSTNKGDWILEKIADYMQVDGKPLGEQNPKGLQDDYVKFLRFAQWKIEQAGCGMVGMITNHGYLDNPTFRGMRQSLMQTFDAIYVLDLHGNMLKREMTPDGGKDENVFDIRLGVAIAFFVKNTPSPRAEDATGMVYHADCYGLRQEKYDWLDAHTLADTPWIELDPQPPFYPLVKMDQEGLTHYNQWLSVLDICPTNSTGIKTHRDHFVLDFDREVLKRRLWQFRDLTMTDVLIQQAFLLNDTRDWKMAERRKSFAANTNWENNLVSCLYRPFDMRWLCYHSDVVELTREAIMRHMLAGENLALCVGRQGQVVGSGEWNLIFCSNTIEDVNLFYRGGNANFPLYLYPDPDAPQKNLFAALEPAERRPNLHPKLLPALAAAYGREPSPEEVFYYVYAVLYAPTYRARYAAFLRMDFPRVPFTAEAETFAALSALGHRLVDLHLLRSPELDPPKCRFENIAANIQHPKSEIENGIVARGKTGLRYDPATERVYINAAQYFGPVPSDVWAYQVGGYQVCEKWLKDRQERRLALDDIRTYCRIVTALGITLALQAEIDAVYAGVERATVSM
jgi:hypothetical protein